MEMIELKHRQKTVHYLQIIDYGKGKIIDFEPGDKVVVKTDEGMFSGVIDTAGRVWLILITGGTIYYHPKQDGTCTEYPIKRIEVKKIKRIAKFPKGFQKYADRHMR